jgi:EmrB/QacA subfamily drug resistance transporter
MALITENNRRWWALGALSVSLFMIMLDNTVVSVALPSIQRDLGTNLSQLEWVINAYAMTFAVLLLTGGKLADYLGRRKVFVAGLVIFALSSLACGLSTSAGMLITFRAVQGIGAACMLPATLSIVTATFPVSERGLAIGIWSGVSGIALAIGPLIGGLLAQHAGWQWIFYVNLPVAVIGIFATFWLVEESRDTSADQHLDVPGLVLAGAGVFLATFALTEANSYGWGSATIILCFVGAAVALAAFVVFELRQQAPMLPLSLFKNPTFTGGNVAGLLMFVALFGQIFFSSIFLQAVTGYSATKAGASFLIATGCVTIMAPISGILSDKIGARIPAVVGMVVYGIGMIGLSTLDASAKVGDFAPWLAIGGLGFGLIIPALTAGVMSSVPVDIGGVASGVMQSFRQLGGGLGVALMGALVIAQVGSLHPGEPGYAVKFASGYSNAMLVGGIVSFASAALAAVTVRRSEHVETPAAAGLGV